MFNRWVLHYCVLSSSFVGGVWPGGGWVMMGIVTIVSWKLGAMTLESLMRGDRGGCHWVVVVVVGRRWLPAVMGDGRTVVGSE